MGTERRLRLGDLGPLGTLIVWSLLIVIALFIGLSLLMFGLLNGMTHFFLHLIGGFFPFLATNIPLISVNAATWVPGVVALLLAALGIHIFLRPWMVKRGRRWTWGSSFASVALLPVLFVIAFLVPGILLQVQGLSDIRWFSREQGKSMNAKELVEGYWMAALEYSGDHDDRFPDTLEGSSDHGWIEHFQNLEEHGRHYWDRDLPREPVIYLGAGLTMGSEGSLALVISPPFSGPHGRARYVATVDGETILISADEVDAWIQRSLAARRGNPP